MTLCLLLLFSMLVTLSAGALYYVSRTASEAYLYQQGLSSVYEYVGIPHGGGHPVYGIGCRGRVQADGADHVHERRA